MLVRGDLRLLCAKLFRDYMFESIFKQIQVHFMVSRLQKCEKVTFYTIKRARTFVRIFIKLNFTVTIHNF